MDQSLGLGGGLTDALTAYLQMRQLRRSEDNDKIKNLLLQRQADLQDREQTLRESKDQGDKIKEFLTNLPQGDSEISPEMYGQIQKEGFAPTFASKQNTLPALRMAPAVSAPVADGQSSMQPSRSADIADATPPMQMGDASNASVTPTGKFVARPFQTPAMKDAELRATLQAAILAERQRYGDQVLDIRRTAEHDTNAWRSEANSIRNAYEQSAIGNQRDRLAFERDREKDVNNRVDKTLQSNYNRIIDAEIAKDPQLAYAPDKSVVDAYRSKRLQELGSLDAAAPAAPAISVAGGAPKANLQDLLQGIPATFNSAPGQNKAEKLQAIRSRVSSLGLSPDDQRAYLNRAAAYANQQQ